MIRPLILLLSLALQIPSLSQAAPPESTMVLHYRFDKDPGDTANDLSGHGNDGKIVHGKYLKEVEGKRGVLRFDGRSSFINCGADDSLQLSGDMTIEMWVRQNQPLQTTWGLIFGESPVRSYHFSYAYGHTLVFWYRDKESSALLPIHPDFINAQWAHLAVVIEYPRARFYRDGRLVRDAYMVMPGVSQLEKRAKHIGGGNDSFAPIDLHEFRLYRRALTGPEIAANASGLPSAPSIPPELAVEPHWYNEILTTRLTTHDGALEGSEVQFQLVDPTTQKVVATLSDPLADVSNNESGRYMASAGFALPQLKDRRLKVVASVVKNGKTTQLAAGETTLTRPEWIHSQAGISEKILPPWTPLEAKSNGKEIQLNVWGREHQFSQQPFTRQITAAGAKLLTAPIALNGSLEGKPIRWQQERSSLESSSDTKAVVTQSAVDGPLSLKVKVAMEYDGYTIYDLELEATQDLSLDALALDIPLASKHAELCYGDRVLPKVAGHAIAEWYSGALDKDQSFRFSPNIWIGDNERGLTWQAESDQGWELEDPQSAIEIHPKGGTTLFQAHFFQRKTELKAGERRHFRFALLATPIKPMVRDAWDLRIARSEPYGADLDLPDRKINGKSELSALRELGIKHLFFNVHDSFPWPMPSVPVFSKALHRLIDTAHAEGMKLYPYLIHQRIPVTVPEFDLYGAQMSNNPFKQYLQPKGTETRPGPVTLKYGATEQGTMFFCPKSKALQDAYIHSLAQRLKEYGDDGVYLDGTMHIVPCNNPDHGCGYRTEDGELRTTYPVFAVREFMRRIYTAVRTADRDGVVDGHCSWGYNPAGLAYCDILWTGEQWHHLRGKGTDYVAGELTLEKFRAEFMGHQLGVPAETLTYRLGSPMKIAATSLLHDVSPRYLTGAFDNMKNNVDSYYVLIPEIWKLRDRFGIKDAEKMFYWNNQDKITITPARCHATLFKHPTNGVLALISNLSQEPQTVEARLHLDQLGLNEGNLQATDALDGETIAMTADGTLSVPLGSEMWKYVWIKPTGEKQTAGN